MKFTKNTVYLLLLNPLLLVIQFLIGYGAYEKIQSVNKFHIEKEQERYYVRNNLSGLLRAESNQRGFLLTGNELFLQNFNKEVSILHHDTVPQSLIDDTLVNKINRLSEIRLEILQNNLRLYGEHKSDSLKTMIFKGSFLCVSVQGLNNTYYQTLGDKFNEIERKERLWIRLLTSIFFFIFLSNLILMYFSINFIKNQLNELSGLNKKLSERNTLLADFTFMTYHKLKEPLRSITGFLQLLQIRAGAKLNNDEIAFINESVAATKKMETNISELREQLKEK